MMHRRLILLLVSMPLIGVAFVAGQQRDAGDMVARIRAEGLQRSRALVLYRTLTDEIGARLTGSPAHMQAARWARDRFGEWGLTNPHLEPYEFGRGWQLEHVSVAMTEPRYMPLIAYAEAWTPGLSRVVTGRVVYVGNKTPAEVQTMSEQLRGAIVLRDLPQTRCRRSRRSAAPAPRWTDAVPTTAARHGTARRRSTRPVVRWTSAGRRHRCR